MADGLKELGDFQESDLLSSRAVHPDVQEIKQNSPGQVCMRKKHLIDIRK